MNKRKNVDKGKKMSREEKTVMNKKRRQKKTWKRKSRKKNKAHT